MSKNKVDMGLLSEHWSEVEKVRHDLADEMDARSLRVGSSLRRQMEYVSDFLRGQADCLKAAHRPDVLAFVMPLVRSIDQGKGSSDAVASSVHRGVCLLAQHGSGGRKLSRVLLLPFLLTIFSVVAFLFLSHWILPHFEQLFIDFGITLPMLTDAVLGLGRLLRRSTALIVGLASAILPVYLLINWLSRRRHPGGPGVFDRWLCGKRLTVSRWLFHASLLLEAGVGAEGFALAGASSGSRWLARRSKLIASDKPAFVGRRFAMAQAGIEMPQSSGKIAILRQVATWYRDNSGNFFDWWIQLFVSMYCWFVIAFFAFVIAALLLPLTRLISGLSGGGLGGFF